MLHYGGSSPLAGTSRDLDLGGAGPHPALFPAARTSREADVQSPRGDESPDGLDEESDAELSVEWSACSERSDGVSVECSVEDRSLERSEGEPVDRDDGLPAADFDPFVEVDVSFDPVVGDAACRGLLGVALVRSVVPCEVVPCEVGACSEAGFAPGRAALCCVLAYFAAAGFVVVCPDAAGVAALCFAALCFAALCFAASCFVVPCGAPAGFVIGWCPAAAGFAVLDGELLPETLLVRVL